MKYFFKILFKAAHVNIIIKRVKPERHGGLFSPMIKVAIVTTTLFTAPALAESFTHNGAIDILFPPEDDLAKAVITEITGARKEILVFAYSFTHKKIAASLIEKHNQGVTVRILSDASRKSEKGHRVGAMRDAGVEVIRGPERRSWHNKTIVIDGRTVITGSANFTHAAQYYNRENVVIIRDNPAIAEHYRTYWHQLASEGK